mmetsp:Transcript_10796/g.21455  ORF Transcript_10796/g.21455 Transcript_10796/m.21455 type:complete len:321 (+) Transcript_10796:283-1245(+)
MRKLLEYHCSGSDTLLGSANVGASIFILLLLGFVFGFGSSQCFVWIRRRKQRKYDMEYRNRYKDKALGEIPDVDCLIKSAVFAHGQENEESEGGGRKQSSVNSESSSQQPRPPGPLENGSMRCLSASIDKSTALLRTRTSTLSQGEEAIPSWRRSIASLSNVTDPESPLPVNFNEKRGLSRRENDDQIPDMIPAHGSSSVGYNENALFKGDSRLDASANMIIAHSMRESFKEVSSFDPPFQSAWERKTEGDFPTEHANGNDDDSHKSHCPGDEEQAREEDMIDGTTIDDEYQQLAEHASNPFATTKESIDAANAAIKEMV